MDAQAVGLVLVVPAEFKEQNLEPDHGERRDFGDVLVQGAGHENPAQHEELAAHGPGGVTGVDVAQLVADDGGQGGLVVHDGQHAPGDIDVSARSGEGVDHRGVQDGEVVGKIGAVGDGDHLAADGFDVGVERLVVVDAVFLPDADVRLLPHLDFHRFRDDVEFLLAGDGVDDAAREGQQEEKDGESADPSTKFSHVFSPFRGGLTYTYHRKK